jgi:hypothetical protein
MDVVEAMMCRWQGKNTSPLAESLLAIAAFEVPHEIRDTFARWRGGAAQRQRHVQESIAIGLAPS